MSKLYTLFLLSVCYQFLYLPLAAQEERLFSYSGKGQALSEVLNQWEKQYDLVFAYESSLLEQVQVSAQFEQLPLSDALQSLLASTSISFEILGPRYIVLRQSEKLKPLQKLCGTVVDKESGEALAYASVGVVGTHLGTQSDEEGRFAFRGNFEEVDQLIISYVGYQSQTISIATLLNKPCTRIVLAPAIQWIPEIIVQEFTVDMLDFGKYRDPIKMRPQKIPTLPGWGEPDIFRSLQLIPGISATGESAANLNIRGGTSDQNLILWDGIPIYHSGHFFGLYSAFNPYVVQEVDVYRGGFGAEYGGRISGVIDIQGKPSTDGEARYGFGLNFLNAHAFAEIPLIKSKSTLLLAARRSFTDLIQSSTYQSLFNSVFQKGRISDNLNDEAEEAESYPNFHYEDYHMKWVWKPEEKQNLALSAYFGNDAFDYNYNYGEIFESDDFLKLNNWGLSLRSTRDWNDRSQTMIEGSFSAYLNRYEFRYSFEPDSIPFDVQLSHLNRMADATFRLHHSWKPHPGIQLSGGWQYSMRNIQYEYQELTEQDNREFGGETFRNRSNSFYGEVRVEPVQNLAYQLGIRRDEFRNFVGKDFEIRDELSWQTRYSVQWNPGGRAWSFTFTGGDYSQFLYQIPAYYNDLGAGEQLWVSADDYFPVLHANQWSFGLAYQKSDWEIELEYYFKNTRNLSSRKLELEEDLLNPFNQSGQARVRGLDVLLRKTWKRYSLWVAYSFTKAENRFPDLIDYQYFPTDQDQRHRLNFTHMLNLKHWDLSLSWQYRSGGPYSVPESYGEFFNSEGDLGFFLNYSGPNNARLPAYHRLDLAGNYKFYRPKWQGKIGLSILNFYNRKNISDVDYFVFPPDASEGRNVPEIVGFERKMLGFTPNLFFQIEW